MMPKRLVSFSTDGVFERRHYRLFRKTLDSLFELDLSFAQHTTLGELVGDIFYNSSILSLIKHGGYPHNGGEHTLYLVGTVDELQTVLDLVQERFTVRSSRAVALCQLKEIQRDLYLFAGVPYKLHEHQQQALEKLTQVGNQTLYHAAGAGKCL
jgi:hypothetical protein